MRVLVTGGAGFLGSHLVEALLARGDEVLVLDNFDPFYARERKEANLAAARRHPRFLGVLEGDLRDPFAVREALAVAAPEVVAHLAARAGVRPSLEEPALYADVNVRGTAVLLEAMRAARVRRLLLASSSTVYGVRARGPFREEEPGTPVSPYGASKRAAELLAASLAAHGEFEVTAVRIFSAYGPRLRPDLAIHRFARAILRGEPVPIYGDGSAERDFTFVADLVDGLLRALDRIGGFRVYNLGRGEPVSVNRLVELLEEALGARAERRYLPPRPGDVPRTWASIERARTELGYAPSTDLREGLRVFAKWFQEHEPCAS